MGSSLADAYRRALECDPVSAFGGVLAFNRTLDRETAEEIAKIFTEVIIAPDADIAARDVLAAKKNLRLLIAGGLPDPHAPGLAFRSVSGGMLVQTRDDAIATRGDLKIVTKRKPTDRETIDMLFALKVAKHVKSNAIVYARDGATVGIGAGQMSRVDSARLAAMKARETAQAAGWPEPKIRGSAAASEAFFPFADGLRAVAEAGATAVIQPGGSVKDDEVIAAADELGLAMAFTGQPMSITDPPNSSNTDRLAIYRARAEFARREAIRANGEARDSYLFLADQWDRLAELAAQREKASGSFG
jgi:phosphoribosylaminoimidazolecarboxamide formyltransferase/IMP cyclohydrolase